MYKLLHCFMALSLLASASFAKPPARQAGSGPRSGAARGAESQVHEDRGIVALDQALRELSNPYSVMCLAAHPEDADWGTLAYYRKRFGARTLAVFVTRGESAPPASAEEAGVRQTRAALRAARIAGSDVYFLNLRDAGPAKSADETIALWGHDEALGRMVRAVRLLRPDVIITNHRSNSRDGQQQAAARLLLEAFEAAPDASKFAQEGTEPWQPRRVFQRTMVNEGEVAVDLNEYDHVRGMSYARIGLAAAEQVAQRDAAQPEETGKVFYKLARATPGEKVRYASALFDGLALPENLVRSIAPPRVGDLLASEALALRERLIDALIDRLLEKRAEGTAAALHERYGSEFFRVIRYTEALERAIAIALGVGFDVALSDSEVVPGQKISARFALQNGSAVALSVVFNAPEQLLSKEAKPDYSISEVIQVQPGGRTEKEYQYEVPKDAVVTLPHSSRLYDENYYPIGSTIPGAQSDRPFGAKFIGYAQAAVAQTTITLPVLRRFDIVPEVEVSTIPVAVLKDWSKPRALSFNVRLRNRTAGPLAGRLWIVPLALSVDDYQPARVEFAKEDEEIAVKMNLKLPILKPPLASDILLEFRRDDPPQSDPLAAAKIEVKVLEFNLPDDLKVGYISGLDSSLSEALGHLGVEHAEIPVESLGTVVTAGDEKGGVISARACDLSRFNTIVVDSRALAAHPELAGAGECLSAYAARGGNLVILAQAPSDWNPLAGARQLSPHAIKLSAERIGAEAAAFKIIEPEHPLMLQPNRITDKDFENWVGPRATDLPGEWASEYRALLEWADAGGEPERGALLVAQSGEGTIIYTSLDLKAQVLALNPGAFRIFANILSNKRQS